MPSTLPTRRLGSTDMEITRVGFGSLAMGGSQWVSGRGEQSETDSLTSARAAIEAGVNWIDTAPVYGRGLAEELLGSVLRDFPAEDRPLVFTKAGLGWDDDDPRGEPTRTGDPARIRAEVDDSLRRLGVERIDLYQMHWPPLDDHGIEDYWPVFAELRTAGKVRAIGLSNHNVAELHAAEQIAHVDSMQPPLSALTRDALADVVPAALANGTGVLAYAPMESGLLTGGFTAERAARLSDTDWRRTSPEHTGAGLQRNLQVVQAMTDVAHAHGVSTSAVAVAWTLAFDGVSAAIVGARTPRQVRDWIAAAHLDLTTEDLELIALAIESSGAGTGPARVQVSA
ncbi:aryl-alcohol dehydrogenase-like predicted oxidoreductase [Kineococcus radiotolerans]|uniref:Aryl-alcohol dehydrogenase-like predicted oxidoreductase n=1 Tax=Kineococcus radiotolerans TaxID=131568 RepID=A0A7W4TR73_KINRA|nr:aldo/keto reductase [Kineococcus radiotolerans]MBB2903564.1 aryl-alcohol dehydrogenase-like predicted oxidoreductase [Kineococcus radiotolerans]